MRFVPVGIWLLAAPSSLAAQTEADSARHLIDLAVAQGVVGSAIVLIAVRNRVVLLHAAGELGAGTPMPTDAIARLASITKPITAVAVLLLEQRGSLRLDDPVDRWYPGFGNRVVQGSDTVAAQRKVTVRDLLTHVAGVATSGPEYDALFDAPSADAYARGIGALPLRFQPGTQWEYGCCGSAFEVLGAIIERVSGSSLRDFLTEQVFRPLGMRDTYFSVPPEKRARLAAVYRREPNGPLVRFRELGQEEKETAFYSGAGGLRSTVQDYLRFVRFLLGRGQLDGVQLLLPEAVDRMLRNQVDFLPASQAYGWGFGVQITTSSDGGLPVGSFGWSGGTGTRFLADPATGRIAIIFVPSNPGTPGVTQLQRSFIAAAFAGR